MVNIEWQKEEMLRMGECLNGEYNRILLGFVVHCT